MQWLGRRGSDNVEDGRSGGGGFGGFNLGGLGGGGILIVLILSLIMGRNPLSLIGMGGGDGNATEQTSAAPTGAPAESDSAARFVSVVLADTEDIWTELFSKSGQTYRPPTLHLYRSEVSSACGGASSATGPFYCPGDEKLYIDLSFYDELRDRFGAPGDFAMAYVVAHEVGHHVQKLLGTSDKMDQMRASGENMEGANGPSVRLELQADYYAGVWAHYEDKEKHVLDPGDINEALTAASAVGDDRIEQQTQGRVVPDSFTHGTSAQRKHWFGLGYQTGDPAGGDTFGAGAL